jgi:plastocyanin
MRSPFVYGGITALASAFVVALAVAGLVIWSGVVDVSAGREGGALDRVLGYASMRSIRRHATGEQNPLANDAAALKSGSRHYRAMCVQCHGAPDREPAEFAAGLSPAAPDLASRESQSFTDGMLYRTIANGIHSTGMPAFGGTHRREQIWSIVTFVRHLPKLAHERKQRPRADHPAEEEGAAAEPQHGNAREGRLHVSISAFRFVPAVLDVHSGDTVVWTNDDFVVHSATASDGSFDTGAIEAGQSKSIVVKGRGGEGTVPYTCRYHSKMSGTIRVQ